MKKQTRTVHVVAWQYSGGAGFDWYARKADADKAYVEEKNNEQDPALKLEGWTAYQFSADVPAYLSGASITRMIDSDLDERCASAGPSRKQLFPIAS